MIGIPRAVRVWVHREPVDMRKSFDTLAAVVRAGMGVDVLEGGVFVFVGRRRHSAKVLYWDGTGHVVLANYLSSHYTAFGFSRGPWPRLRDAWIAAARSLRRSQRLQCFWGRWAGSS